MKRIILTLIICLALPVMAMDFVVTDNLDVLQVNVSVNASNAFKHELNELDELVTINKTIEDFTYFNIIDGKVYIQITGGYAPNNSFNSRKYPVTEEIYSWYESLGATINISEYKEVIKNNSESEF